MNLSANHTSTQSAWATLRVRGSLRQELRTTRQDPLRPGRDCRGIPGFSFCSSFSQEQQLFSPNSPPPTPNNKETSGAPGQGADRQTEVLWFCQGLPCHRAEDTQQVGHRRGQRPLALPDPLPAALRPSGCWQGTAGPRWLLTGGLERRQRTRRR